MIRGAPLDGETRDALRSRYALLPSRQDALGRTQPGHTNIVPARSSLSGHVGLFHAAFLDIMPVETGQ